jgi:Ca2+-binding EF-hand superfamily protein
VLAINGTSVVHGLHRLMEVAAMATSLTLLVAPVGYVPDAIKEIKGAILRKLQRITDLFRQLDKNGDGRISRREFVSVLPLVLNTHHTAEQYRAAFDVIDADGSGEIDYKELKASLSRDDVELAAELQAGAMGEIETEAKNRVGLRPTAHDGSLHAPLAEILSAEELKAALRRGAGRVMDCFRAMDRNGDQTVTRREFAAALPLLGFASSNRPVIEAIFDEIDSDGSGSIDYKELNSALRRDDVTLAAELQAGAMGEIETAAKNAIALRFGGQYVNGALEAI